MLLVIRRKLLLILIAVLLLASFSLDSAAADSTSDAVLVRSGDVQGFVSALQAGNARGPEASPYQIYLEAGQYFLSGDSSALPAITGKLAIYGQASLIGLDSSVTPIRFVVAEGASVEFHNIIFEMQGGVGRAILNHGQLALYDSSFGSTSAETVQAGKGEGGGIENYGTLTVARTIFAHNQYISTNEVGGAVFNSGAFTATCTQFQQGRASRGGAVFNAASGTTTITDGSFSDNRANGGGSIFNDGGTVTVANSFWPDGLPEINNLFLGMDTISDGISVESIAMSDPTQSGDCLPLPPVAIPADISVITPSSVTFTVLNANDSGANSLRQAIIDANTTPTIDTINFNIPGAGVHTITLLSALPEIAQPVIVDGYSQPGTARATSSTPATLLIELNGASAGTGVSGLTLSGPGGSAVAGLVINRFNYNGILINSDQNTIRGTYIGTDASGSSSLPNGSVTSTQFTSAGIRILNLADSNVIGSAAGETDPTILAQNRNVISGNKQEGIGAYTQALQNSITGNYIGLDATGMVSLPNQIIGMRVEGSQAIIDSNLVWAWNYGITIGGDNVVVRNNWLGINKTQSIVTPVNVPGGITIFRGVGNVVMDNIVKGSHGAGISIYGGTGDVVQRNRVERNHTGILIRSDPGDGDHLVGGYDSSAANIVDQNDTGIYINREVNFGVGIGSRVLGNIVTNSNDLGIDLRYPTGGVTLNDVNDVDTGPNGFQNFPVITSAVQLAGNVTINGTLNSKANTAYRIEFFANSAYNLSGYGEGEAFLGYADVTTNGSGNVSFSPTFAQVTGKPYITATATGPEGTSEFSAYFLINGTPVPGAMTLNGPTGDITQRTPTFTWQREATSTSYQVIVQTGEGTQLLNQNYSAATVCNVTTCSVTPAFDLDSWYYTWFVRGFNEFGAGATSGSNFAVMITPAALTQNGPSGAITSRKPTFTWTADRDARWYGIWIGTGSGTQLHYQFYDRATVCTGNTCSLTPSLSLSSDYYSWYVGGYSIGGGGPWSAQYFTVNILPTGLTQTAPKGNITSRKPTFIWTANRDALWYGISVVNSASQTVFQQWYPRAQVCISNDCSLTPSLDLDADNYNWYVGGYSLSGSGPWNFKTFRVNIIPGTTTLTSPTGTISNPRPTLTWQRNRDANYYGIYLVSLSTGQTILQEWRPASEVCSGNTCTRPLTADFPAGDYQWSVGGIGVAGEGPWSSLSFTVQ